jgi:hypothetical protein
LPRLLCIMGPPEVFARLFGRGSAGGMPFSIRKESKNLFRR